MNNNEREIFTIEDAIKSASLQLDPEGEIAHESEMSQLFLDIESHLFYGAAASGKIPLIEGPKVFDAEAEKKRFMNDVFYNFEVACEIELLFVAEDFIEFFDEWYCRRDDLLSLQTTQYASDRRKVLEEITLPELLQYARGEYERHYEILRNAEEDFFVEVAHTVDNWEARARVVEAAIDLDRSGYGPRHERKE